MSWMRRGRFIGAVSFVSGKDAGSGFLGGASVGESANHGAVRDGNQEFGFGSPRTRVAQLDIHRRGRGPLDDDDTGGDAGELDATPRICSSVSVEGA